MTDPTEDGDSTAPPRGALGRGLLVLLAALVIGVLVLNSIDKPAAKSTSSKKNTSTATTTTVAPSTTTVPLRSPADVKVIVANGTNTSGVAQTATNSLKLSKYTTADPVKSNSSTTIKVTSIYYATGYQQEATVLAAALALPPSTLTPWPANASDIPVSNTAGANIVVVIGEDQASSFVSSSSATTSASSSATTVAKSSSATTTTVKKTTSTTRKATTSTT